MPNRRGRAIAAGKYGFGVSYVLAVTWVAKPGEEEEVAGLLRELSASAETEPGCLQFKVHRALDDRRRFLLYEVYRDEAGFEAHQQTEHFKRLVLGQGLPLLEKRERLYYEPL
jgi:quinol monooxygenase YgiN